MFAIIGPIAKVTSILILVLFLPALCSAQDDDKDTIIYFSKTKMIEDIEILESSLKAAHPGLYDYQTEAELTAQFLTLRENLEDSLTSFQLYQRLNPIIASIQCGHTTISPATPTDEDKLFPLGVRFVDSRAYIFENYSYDSTIVQATEILSIEGQPISDVITQLWTLVPADANIEPSKWRRLENGFSWYYASAYGQLDSFLVTGLLYETQDTVTLKLSAVSTRRVIAIASQLDHRQALPLQLNIFRDQSLAVLKINSFASQVIRWRKQHYRRFIRKSFRKIRRRRVNYLVIDVRENGGGSDKNATLLLSYLLDKEFKCFEDVKFAGNEVDQIIEYSNFAVDSNYFSAKSTLLDDSTYSYMEHPNLQYQSPQRKTFEGEVLVLIGGGSASITGVFSSMMHFHKRAEFAGQECGTNYYQVNGFWTPMIRLPNSGIFVSIPITKAQLAVDGYPKDGRGVMPDYAFDPTLEDLIKRRDLEMEFVFDWIKQKESE